jgi:hypothetical protein
MATITVITAVIIMAEAIGTTADGLRLALALLLPQVPLLPRTTIAIGGMATGTATRSDAGRIAPALGRGRGFSVFFSGQFGSQGDK